MRCNFGQTRKIAHNFIAFALDYIVMQMRKVNRENGYWEPEVDLKK